MDDFGIQRKFPKIKRSYLIGLVVVIVIAVVVFSLRDNFSGFVTKEKTSECNDGVDNDLDKLVDYDYDKKAKEIKGDPDCVSLKDNSEAKDCPGIAEECNGLDDDCDGFIDEGACPFCGNNNLDPGEECDGTDFDGKKCSDVGNFNIGELKCKDCKLDKSSCKVIICGNNIIDPGEECDSNNWGVIEDCQDFDFTGGTLKCVNCKFDKSGCVSTKPDSCEDYDDGEAYDEFGWVFGILNNLEYNISDKCISEEKLKEYYCEDNERKSLYYDCTEFGDNATAYVCEDGRCAES